MGLGYKFEGLAEGFLYGGIYGGLCNVRGHATHEVVWLFVRAVLDEVEAELAKVVPAILLASKLEDVDPVERLEALREHRRELRNAPCVPRCGGRRNKRPHALALEALQLH
jgi:hypothetical protein